MSNQALGGLLIAAAGLLMEAAGLRENDGRSIILGLVFVLAGALTVLWH